MKKTHEMKRSNLHPQGLPAPSRVLQKYCNKNSAAISCKDNFGTPICVIQHILD